MACPQKTVEKVWVVGDIANSKAKLKRQFSRFHVKGDGHRCPVSLDITSQQKGLRLIEEMKKNKGRGRTATARERGFRTPASILETMLE